LIGEADCILETFLRTLGKIHGHKDPLNCEPWSGFRLSPCFSYHEYRTWRMPHNSLSCAPEENVLQSCAPMRWHHDKIGRNFLRETADFIERRCAT
jgi:hypothetical protein